jgi:streptomycin 6-kinase
VSAATRAEQLAAQWGVEVHESFETPSSLIAYGHRDGQPVVLKVVKVPNDERHSGAVLEAFAGRGMARVLQHTDGAMLLERLQPGTSLVEVVRRDGDDAATTILASVIRAMAPVTPPVTAPTVADWALGFARYRASCDTQIATRLVDKAERLYLDLCASQRIVRLLHGDLQHYNVLLDQNRGWLAIDPKGVIGEVEYEVGASMRNPVDMPDVFANAEVITRRLDRFCSDLRLDRRRARAWSFAQAVLSAIWGVEDGYRVRSDNASLLLAITLEPTRA